MRSLSLKHFLSLSTKGTGPIAKLVAASKEAGIVVPSVLAKNLEAAGFKVTYHVGPGEDAEEGDHKHGAWVLVKRKGKKGDEVVARAYSSDKEDALLQAVYASLKEEAGSQKDAKAPTGQLLKV